MKLNKFSRVSISVLLSINIVLTNTSFIVRAEATTEGNTVAKIDGDKITIGNDYINREFSINENKVLTSLIENRRANTEVLPKEGSEDFIINTIQTETPPESEEEIPIEKLDSTNWESSLTTKDGTEYPESDVVKLFDGDSNTYINNYTVTGYPISLKIDLGEEKTVSSFSYLKRPGFENTAYGINGTMGQYKLYISEDGVNWQEAGSGEFKREDFNLHQEEGLHNVGDIVYGNFDDTYTTRYVRIDQLSDALGNTQEFSGAEISLFADSYAVEETPEEDSKIKSSNLTIDKLTTKIEDIDNGKKVTISYEPYQFKGIRYDIDMI